MVFHTLRVENFEEEASKRGLRENLDLLEEQRAEAHLRTLAYKKLVTKLYNRKGKLTMNWEGPYPVFDTIRDGTYRLATMERKSLLRK
ncbi:hypothetical protein GW17_00029179 [Ensete ventricosum]|nr:hypothetical protein GW17_00029179 [Ensete ventricosum]RZS12893.1 hypothetical protein BHM03_00044400 [Ensete ventricosum]